MHSKRNKLSVFVPKKRASVITAKKLKFSYKDYNVVWSKIVGTFLVVLPIYAAE